MSQLLYVTVLTFACVAMASYGVLGTVFSEERRAKRRLREMSDYESDQVGVAEPLLQPFRSRVLGPVASGTSHVVRSLWPPDYRRRLEEGLVNAGSPRGMGVDRLLVAKVVGPLGGMGLASAGVLLAGLPTGSATLVIGAIVTLLFFAPDLWLGNRVSARQARIVRELPDMLDMLTISVEAGLGFDAALSKLVRNSEGPLAEEFGRALQEVQTGSSRKEALQSLAERANVPEVVAFTSAITQADMFGVSISRVLHTQSGELRLRRRQRAEEQAQKAPVKMVLPLILCILPATMIVVLGPAVARIASMF